MFGHLASLFVKCGTRGFREMIVPFFFAVAAAFLMFLVAAELCLALAIGPPIHCLDYWRSTAVGQGLVVDLN